MKNLIKQLFNWECRGRKDAQKEDVHGRTSRRELEIRVEKGAEKAVNEYGGAFRKLAEYDRS